MSGSQTKCFDAVELMRPIPAVLFLLTSACTTPAEERSPYYQLGFGDGCATASTETSGAPRQPRRNRALYEVDRDYRSGWLSGHAQCQAPGPASVAIRRN
jgi:hypothetical protein